MEKVEKFSFEDESIEALYGYLPGNNQQVVNGISSLTPEEANRMAEEYHRLVANVDTPYTFENSGVEALLSYLPGNVQEIADYLASCSPEEQNRIVAEFFGLVREEDAPVVGRSR